MPSVVLSIVFAAIVCLAVYSIYRLTKKNSLRRHERQKTLLVSLGSGGHTTEMLQMLTTVQSTRFAKRIYYVSSNDSLSVQKAKDFEKSHGTSGVYSIRIVRRARKVKQSWKTTPITASVSFLHSLRLVYEDEPDLLLCNGPGTCVMLVCASLMLRVSKYALPKTELIAASTPGSSTVGLFS